MRFDPRFRGEFQALIVDASARVLAGPADPEGYRRLLQMRAFPSYPGVPAPYTYTLLVSETEKRPSYLLLNVHWDHRADEKKLASPIERRAHPDVLIPAIRTTQTKLPTRTAKKLHDAINALSLPLVAKDPPYGMDGTTIEVIVHADHAEWTFSWWVYPPDEWRPLGAIVDGLIALVPASEADADD
jgi:hypothetical protein